MRMRRSYLLPFFLTAVLKAQTGDGIDYFENKVRPLLVAKCYGCHNGKLAKPMGALRVDTKEGLLHGGGSGAPAVVPGNVAESLMIAAVRGANKDLRMPPGKPLDQADIDVLIAWVKMGAPDPRTDPTAAPVAAVSSYDWEKVKKHWAFQPVKDPAPPAVTAVEWNRTEVDRFIKAKLDARGLKPLGLASKLALIRRATYDLTGLPPAPADVDAFFADTSAGAFEKVVDRLLASQHYGERWGRHWLDVVRYSDTAGDNADFPVPSMYRYRNFVIESFNMDKPYDRFIQEQFAGDLMPAKDNEDRQQKLIATGYLANARRFGSRAKEMYLTIDDTIDNLGKGVLGLSVGCARCHDHKFDPIPNKDYYALFGIFQSTRYAHPGTEIYPHTYGFAALGSSEQELQLKDFETRLSDLDNRIEDAKSGKLKDVPKEKMKDAENEAKANVRAISAKYPNVPKAYAVSDGPGADARVLIKGDPAMPGPSVPRGFLTVLGGEKLPASEKGSGRAELAGWLTDAKNPLTARVIVNRVWAWHFGQGIVATPDDFGARGEAPSNPELLDYLATRFVEDGWSFKKLHKRIMLSRAYRMASGTDDANMVKDSRNAYQWKFNRRRLEAEEIRDSLLAVSGNLDPAKGGEHPFPPEMEWRYSQHKPFIANYETNKRAVYLMQQRIRKQPFLDLFDGGDPNSETGVRPVSTTALQALFTMNDPFFHTQAGTLAAKAEAAGKNDAARLRFAYRTLFGRVPSPEETKDSFAFLKQEVASAPAEKWASLLRVLMSTNEFLTLD